MPKKILITDDALFMRVTLKKLLTANGYEVVGEAVNGQEAVEKYAACRPDLVLMDITMPVMDGIAATRAIKGSDPDRQGDHVYGHGPEEHGHGSHAGRGQRLHRQALQAGAGAGKHPEADRLKRKTRRTMKVGIHQPVCPGLFFRAGNGAGQPPVKGELAAQPTIFTSQQCNVVCGVTGQVQGQVIYGMSLTTADKIASTMLGQPIKTFDALAASAIGELGNMISGNAMQHLSEAGWICDITPPTIMRGTNVKISTHLDPGHRHSACTAPTPGRDSSITIGLQGTQDNLTVPRQESYRYS